MNSEQQVDLIKIKNMVKDAQFAIDDYTAKYAKFKEDEAVFLRDEVYYVTALRFSFDTQGFIYEVRHKCSTQFYDDVKEQLLKKGDS